MVSQSRRGSSSLARVAEELAHLDIAGMRQAERDTIAGLRDVLDQIKEVRAGEFRLVASGTMAAMKSTTLSLLLGKRERVLHVGLGAVTGVPTELRLVQSDDPSLGRSEVRTLSEESARRRSLRLLRLPDDDPRPLADLLGNSNQPEHAQVRSLLAAAAEFGFGEKIDLAEYCQRGGSLDINGFGTALVQRIIVQLPVAATQWDLSWAGNRTVVLVDLPGTGGGQSLAELIRDDEQAIAHVSLSIVGLADGGDFKAQPVGPEPDCIFVGTKLDRVEHPDNSNALRAIEGAIALCLREWQRGDRQVRVAAISGMWAFPDEESWLEFDPSNRHWADAKAARAAWEAAPWEEDGPTGGQFRAAVEAALRDGGVNRLRELITELAGRDRARIDGAELSRLVAQGQQLTDLALADVPNPQEAERLLRRLQEELEKDQEPMNELRRIARDTAAEAVYALPEWTTVWRTFRDDGTWRGSLSEVTATLEGIDLATLASEAMDSASSELAEFLRSWPRRYLPVGVGPAADPDPPPDAGAELAAERFAALGRRVLGQVVAAHDRAGLRFERVAMARAELAPLLERMLVWRLEPMVGKVQADVQARFTQRPDHAKVYQSWEAVVRSVRLELGKLAAQLARQD